MTDMPEWETVTNWSDIPDVYIVRAELSHGMFWRVEACSVPMAIGPEVRLIRADVVEARIAEAVVKEREACAPYLKDGETPAERIERERQDCLALMELLAKEKFRSTVLQCALQEISDLSPHCSSADLGDIAAALDPAMLEKIAAMMEDEE
jgi:hypothetical protein